MIENPRLTRCSRFDFEHLIDNVPKIMLDYRIENISFDHPIDSRDMNPQCWMEIAKAIDDN